MANAIIVFYGPEGGLQKICLGDAIKKGLIIILQGFVRIEATVVSL